MRAVYAASTSQSDPLAGLVVGKLPAPPDQPGWVRVQVRATSLNHHDIWSLRGVGLPTDRLPMILGCDAAGVTDDGTEVVVHSVISTPGWVGDETEDPGRTLLSEWHPGTWAEQVLVPARNVLPKPEGLTFEESACLPTAWLTAYRMLFTKAKAVPGQTILVQGAGGGVASALVELGSAAGIRMWVTSRTEAGREHAWVLGADRVFETGARLPERVDAVMETVGEATWGHSLRCLRPGGKIVVAGSTSGAMPPADLQRVFFLQLQILGSTMGTLDELHQLLQMLDVTGVRPTIDRVITLENAAEGVQAMLDGQVRGKIVLSVG